jgi:predicted RNA-binding protein YlxR (DUF448 family)
MLRFVVDPDGHVVPDVDGRLPGRGLWLSPGRDMIEIPARRRLFSRAARRAVTVPPDLPDRVEALLIRRCLRLLGLARRAGQVVSGFEKVRARLRESADPMAPPPSGRGRRGAVRRPPAVLFLARDSAHDGRARMAALAFAILGAAESSDPDDAGGRAACRLVVGLDAAELGQPLGRDRAVHVSLEGGRLAKSLLEACALLSGFRPGPMVASPKQARAVLLGPSRETGTETEPGQGATDARDRAPRT